MKNWRHPIVSALLIVLVLFPLAACTGTEVIIADGPTRQPGQPEYGASKGGPPPWAPAHGRRAKHTYQYYPDERVYYDSGRGLYFYYKDGDWAVSARLPIGISVELGSHVMLEMETETPYIYQNEVEQAYPPGKKKDKKNRGKGKKPKKWN